MRYIIHQDGLIHGLGDTRAEAAADASHWLDEDVDECTLQAPSGASADASPDSDLPVIGPATDDLAQEIERYGGSVEFREFRGCFVTKREWDAAHSETSPTAPLDMAELIFRAACAVRGARADEASAAAAAADAATRAMDAAADAFKAADAAYSDAARSFTAEYNRQLERQGGVGQVKGSLILTCE